VAGGLAGIYYGLSAIREEWIEGLAHAEKIGMVLDKFVLKVIKSPGFS
jgi:ADP-ribosylglycohydrolase